VALSFPDINTGSVTRPGAFLGRIARAVREMAAQRVAISSGGPDLDVACGNGLFFALLSPANGRRVGVDLDVSLLHEAKQIFRDNGIQNVLLVRGDAEALPFRNGTFTTVSLLNTLMNFTDDAAVRSMLEEMMRVCCSDGRVLVDIRNRANPCLRLLYWWNNRRRDFEVRGYHLRELSGVFSSAGFRVLASHAVGPAFPFGVFAYLIEAGHGSTEQSS
jgi:SAM-dependent methyltransferase